jgi:undecaprenyl-diphosphatase
MSVSRNLLPVLLLCLPLSAKADGPLWIDHYVTYDDSGIWNRTYQKDLAIGAAVGVIGGAIFTDSDSRLGRTFDQSMDALVFTGASTLVAKRVFSRTRPSESPDPDGFFSGSGHQSFPSGEVAELSAVVTPFIAEYGGDHPWVYTLALLPTYDAIARVKTHGHWQSDVLAGAALGTALGVYSHHRKSPWVVSVMPGGDVAFGYHKAF